MTDSTEMTNIDLIVSCARKLFSSPKSNLAKSNENVMLKYLNQCKVSDLGISHIHFEMSKAPVNYMPIFEGNSLTIGIFLLKSHSKIPLHDHPHMRGYVKVVSGSIKLVSFDSLNLIKGDDSPVFRCRNKQERLFTNSDDCVMLHKGHGDYHSLEPVDGPAAFLDILAPPYGDNECQYMEESHKEGEELILRKISPPMSYWCELIDLPTHGHSN